MDEQSTSFIISVLVVIFKEGKFLAMRRSKDKKVAPLAWETLSGRLQEKEEPREGLLREIQEESGLEVELDLLPFDLYMTTYAKKPMLSIIYKANYLSGEVKLSHEHSEFRWVSFSEFEKLSTLKKLVQSIKKLSIAVEGIE